MYRLFHQFDTSYFEKLDKGEFWINLGLEECITMKRSRYLNLFQDLFQCTTRLGSVRIESNVQDGDMIRATDEVLATLTPREEQLIKLRYAVGNLEVKQTLNEIGKSFGLTGSRIHQVEATALRKLRHPARSRRLEEFLSVEISYRDAREREMI